MSPPKRKVPNPAARARPSDPAINASTTSTPTATPTATPTSPPTTTQASDPSPPKPDSDPCGRSLELLGKVRSGAIAGSMLAAADRQALVTLLAVDGLTTPEIAQILQVSDRTIERDRKAIRAANAVAKDPRLVEQMVGRLIAEAECSVQRIRRTTRDREVDAGIKVDAEHRCFQIVRDLVHALQRLGYLPTATQKLDADLTHHIGELPSFADLNAEIDRLKVIQGEAIDNSPSASLAEVERAVAHAALASRVKDLALAQEPTAIQEENPHAPTS